MKELSIFKGLYMSFYSKRLYRDVATSWGGYTVLYLFMLVSLSWIGTTWQIQKKLSQWYQQYAYEVTAQIPVMAVADGKLSTPKAKPYLIHDPFDKNNVFAIIDTTGKYTDIKSTHATILVTSNKIIINKSKNNEIRSYQIPKAVSQSIVPATIYEMIQGVIGYAWIPLFIACVMLTFVYRLIQAFIYGIIGLIFNYFYGGKLSFSQITQIAMIAITPVIILTAINDFFAFHYKHQLLLYFTLAMFYLCYGIIANNKSENKD